MTARRPILTFLLSTVAGFLLMFGVASLAAADPPGPAPTATADNADDIARPNVGPYRDAGVATSDIATAPVVVVADLPDPISEPAKAYAVSKETLAEDGRWALIGVVLTMALRALSKRIKTSSRLAFLRKWRWPAIFGGLTAIVGAATEVLVAGGTWTAVTLAVVAALITLVDGFGADEDKPIAATA